MEEKEVKATQPRKRRGVSNDTKATTQLKFHEKDAAGNGLFIGHLESVQVDYSESADNKVFSGLKVPRLTFHFASNHTNVQEQRHVYQTFFPVESSVDTTVGGKDEWKVSNIFKWTKHMLDIYYLQGRQFTEEEEELLSLPFDDYDYDNQEFIIVEPEEVLNGYSMLFNNIAAIMNGTLVSTKCCYKDANGKPYSIWMKLLRHKKRRNEWVNVGQNGDLAFDSFIGNGVIELQKPNMPPTLLFLDLTKESITPKETKKEPTLGGQNAMLGIAGNIVNPDMNAQTGVSSAYMDAINDMPF